MGVETFGDVDVVMSRQTSWRCVHVDMLVIANVCELLFESPSRSSDSFLV